MRREAAFNLPCFHLVLRDECDAQQCDFQELYSQFLNDIEKSVQKVIPTCIHEAFTICSPEEDMWRLRDTYKSILDMNDKETIEQLVENLHVTLEYYCNEHALRINRKTS